MQDFDEKSVLFVDDEKDMLYFFENIFKDRLDRIYLESDPARAYETAVANPIDVMVTDLKMLGMDGVTLFEKVKAVKPSISGIFVTGYGERQFVQAALRLGAVEFLDKPFNCEHLIHCVEHAVERAHYERAIRDVLSLFIIGNSRLSLHDWEKLSFSEKEKTLRSAMGLAKMQLLNIGYASGRR